MKLETIIGLETHVQLKTNTKMFCPCSNKSEEADPNTNICPICLGHPGTLPVVNKEAIMLGIRASLQIGCKIHINSPFDRKNYVYPDLPKSYQISQFGLPIGHDGEVSFFVNGGKKKLRIERLHLEEDAAKLIHPDKADYSLVDYNRGGTPLAEIVTQPELHSAEEAKAYMQELRLMMKGLGVSDADMEKGHLRCDANISLRPVGEDKLYAKTEVKNLNSYRAVEKAILFEEKRQRVLWEKGTPNEKLTTRGWDEHAQKTYEQRTKEEAHDYRYFPEPDLPPLKFVEKSESCEDIPFDEIRIDCIQSSLPERPFEKVNRFIEQYSFSFSDSKSLVENDALASFAENTITELKNWLSEQGQDEAMEDDEKTAKKLGKLVGGWITTEINKWLNEKNKNFEDSKISPENFAELLGLVILRKITSNSAQALLPQMMENGSDPTQLIDEQNLGMVDDESELESIVSNILKENPKVTEEVKNGKETAIKFLIGQVMKESKGRANPAKASDIIKRLTS